jgi:large subunit ribosomal protein L15
MMIHDITPKVPCNKKRKRLGRGIASGHGKTCGRGTKGAGARSGWGGSIRASREGGSMPLFRRLPKRGFSNFDFRKHFVVVNVKDLETKFNTGDIIDAAALVKVGLIHDVKTDVKVLGDGEITKKLTVNAAYFSKSAAAKIAKAGGTANGPVGKEIVKIITPAGIPEKAAGKAEKKAEAAPAAAPAEAKPEGKKKKEKPEGEGAKGEAPAGDKPKKEKKEKPAE